MSRSSHNFMKRKNLQVFVHIPKSGGTSFKRSCVFNNYKNSSIFKFNGLKNFALSSMQDIDFVDGHVCYGIHLLTRRKCDYFTLLRDPLDQAISYYYFVRQCNYPNYKHPLLAEALNFSLIEFTERYCNMQTRAIAGLGASKLSKFSSGTLVEIAKKNLFSRFKFYGFLDKFEDFCLNWSNKYSKPYKSVYESTKITRNRPKVSDFNDSDLLMLKNIQKLDIELYRSARDRCIRT